MVYKYVIGYGNSKVKVLAADRELKRGIWMDGRMECKQQGFEADMICGGSFVYELVGCVLMWWPPL